MQLRRSVTVFSAVLMLAGGCASMEKFGQAMKEAGDKYRAEQEEAARKATIQAHLNENLPNVVAQGDDIHRVVVAVERIQQAKGYNCHEVAEHNGADGKGIRVDCDQRKAADLGSSVAQNVLGNMLGADRGKIIKGSVDENGTSVRVTWAADGTGNAHTIAVGMHGKRYKVNQNDVIVDEVAYNSSDEADLVNALRAALK